MQKRASGSLLDMLASATFDTRRMKEEAGKGSQPQPNLPIPLSGSYGLPFRTAHTIVGRAVQKGDLSLATLEEAAQEIGGGISLVGKGLTQQNIDEVLDVKYSVALRKAPGDRHPLQSRSPSKSARNNSITMQNSSTSTCRNSQKQKRTSSAEARRLVA